MPLCLMVQEGGVGLGGYQLEGEIVCGGEGTPAIASGSGRKKDRGGG